MWERGTPPTDLGGLSGPINLQFLLALQWAADLEESLGDPTRARELRQDAARFSETFRTRFWHPSRKLFRDTPRSGSFSQHTNALAVLAGVTTGEEARDLVLRVINNKSLEPCSYYFAHYLHEAAMKVGEGGRYPDFLGGWRTMLDLNLTTWCERPLGAANTSRSDCHGWGAGPNVHVFRGMLGIDSGAAGFKRVIIRPAIGERPRLSGAIPHPAGMVAVAYERTADGGLRAKVQLPPGIDGEFHWRGTVHPLHPGANSLDIAP
jgi:hypothetical protein